MCVVYLYEFLKFIIKHNITCMHFVSKNDFELILCYLNYKPSETLLPPSCILFEHFSMNFA